MSRRALAGLLVAAVASATLFAACQETAVPTATPVKFEPTPAPAGSPLPTSTRAPAPTATPVKAGDAARGQQLFAQNGCSACHRTDSTTLVGPGLAGLAERAGTRVAGQPADAYIEESIRDPGKFIVPGFQNLMPATFGALPAADIADLMAYIKSLK